MMSWHVKLKQYDNIIEHCPNIERKGKTMPYTSANGHMFSLFNKAGKIGFRYSKEIQEQYIREFNSTIYKSYNSVMKGYVLIPEEMWSITEKMVDLLTESYEYVMSLPSK